MLRKMYSCVKIKQLVGCLARAQRRSIFHLVWESALSPRPHAASPTLQPSTRDMWVGQMQALTPPGLGEGRHREGMPQSIFSPLFFPSQRDLHFHWHPWVTDVKETRYRIGSESHLHLNIEYKARPEPNTHIPGSSEFNS